MRGAKTPPERGFLAHLLKPHTDGAVQRGEFTTEKQDSGLELLRPRAAPELLPFRCDESGVEVVKPFAFLSSWRGIPYLLRDTNRNDLLSAHS